MAKELPNLPDAAKTTIERVIGTVTKPQIDRYGQIQEIEQKRLENEQKRKAQKTYAYLLIGLLITQVIAIYSIFILMGCGILKYDQGTAIAFFTGVFAEVCGLVYGVIKYLFPSASENQPKKSRLKSSAQSGKKNSTVKDSSE